MRSRQKLHPARDTYWGNLAARSVEYCHGAMQDFAYISRQARIDSRLVNRVYHVVRYEDLAHRPREMMQEIYEFLEVKPDNSLESWIQEVQTGVDGGLEGPENKDYSYKFSTDRENSAYASIIWRNTINFEDNKVIEQNCHDFMKFTGYTFSANETTLRNTNISLISRFDVRPIYEGTYIGDSSSSSSTETDEQ